MDIDALLSKPQGLLLAAAMLATGCATVQPTPDRGTDLRYQPRISPSHVAAAAPVHSVPAVRSSLIQGASQGDAWEQLLTEAGLESGDERPLSGSALMPAQAARLLELFLKKPVTLGSFPARMAVGYLLRGVLERGEVSREELLRRVERFNRVAVLRPDGYLAWTRSGRTQQKVAPIEWKDGAFRARQFELGRFYVSNGFVFRLANEQLEPLSGPVQVEVYDDADYVSRSLDGAEAAFMKLALALGQLFARPGESLAALKNLPAGVAALIASSPEYFERFRYMTRGEQTQAIAELATNLLVTTGTTVGTTRTVTGVLAGAEATVPVLSLSSEGALVFERVAVPVGRVAMVLGGGPGAALILHRANSASREPAGGRGPGEWGPSEESGMSERARAYQEQISGHSADEAYWVGGVGKKSGGVKFDGFKDGVLLEAKGPGYSEFFDDSLTPKYWFEQSGKADGLVEQARRQLRVVRGMGASIEWHVAERKAADAIRLLFERHFVEGVNVIHTPAL